MTAPPSPELSPDPQTPPPAPYASPCTCFQVRRAARIITGRYDAALAPLGLRITQFSVLAHLVQQPVPLTALAEMLVMDRTTLTRTLKPMLAAGWVTTEADPTDRRIKRAQLTETGLALFEQAVPLWRDTQRAVKDHLGRDFVRDLHDRLTTVWETLSAAP
ncbi:MarR family winged helix-turn-helix transcriptional regulator [Novispirillum itersonii]|uniref:DNA-binding MarR family transcriptional regulator n=1 Tax=Novispirillum itersonii TaxID=189 RepID=A0A7W9ZEI6_NOVIT|nr:MarR family winged helix-turn-helix transcriptional regulator [Novispirillum itersonii]MBB6209780.1 DNA-binding MarR family transcriptional regulator [Novispirillum itersonii]